MRVALALAAALGLTAAAALSPAQAGPITTYIYGDLTLFSPYEIPYPNTPPSGPVNFGNAAGLIFPSLTSSRGHLVHAAGELDVTSSDGDLSMFDDYARGTYTKPSGWSAPGFLFTALTGASSAHPYTLFTLNEYAGGAGVGAITDSLIFQVSHATVSDIFTGTCIAGQPCPPTKGGGLYTINISGTGLFNLDAGSTFSVTPVQFSITTTGTNAAPATTTLTFTSPDLSVIPEPGSLALVGAGLLGAGAMVRTRRRRG